MSTLQKIKKIVPKNFRSKLIYLFILLLFGMFFEMIGIGAMLPVLTTVLKPSIILENTYLSNLMAYIGFEKELDITLFLMVVLVVIYVFKSIFLLWCNRWQNKINANLTEAISNNLYIKYLNKSYLFHVEKNSSEIIKLFQVDINHFNTFIIATIYLITEISIVISIILTLLIVDPLGVFSIIAIFAGFSFCFYTVTKRLSLKWGQLREQNDRSLSKLLLETFGGIKEIIKTNSFTFFNDSHRIFNSIRASVSAKNMTLNQVPRYFLEIITILALIVFIFINMKQGKAVESIIVTLGVFVAAMLRILPSVNRILSSLQQMKYYQSSIDLLYTELDDNGESDSILEFDDRIQFKDSIYLRDICFDYGKEKKKLLKNINLTIKRGSFTGILGDSGSGKSTLMNILAGLIAADSGEILVDTNKINKSIAHNWRENIGYVSQATYLLDASISENIAFGIDKNKVCHKAVLSALKEAQLFDFVNTLPNGVDTKVGERGVQFSGGQQQRIGIARALYKRPEVLILDEATSALDTQTEKEIMKSISTLKQKITIIMVTHRLGILGACTHIYSLNKGHLILNN